MTATSKCVHIAGIRARVPIPVTASANGGPTTLALINAAAGQPMSDRYESIPEWVAVDFVRCVECGVLIDNTRVHDRWHDRREANR